MDTDWYGWQERLAWHEAGHVVADLASGMWVSEIRISRVGYTPAGFVRFENNPSPRAGRTADVAAALAVALAHQGASLMPPGTANELRGDIVNWRSQLSAADAGVEAEIGQLYDDLEAALGLLEPRWSAVSKIARYLKMDGDVPPALAHELVARAQPPHPAWVAGRSSAAQQTALRELSVALALERRARGLAWDAATGRTPLAHARPRASSPSFLEAPRRHHADGDENEFGYRDGWGIEHGRY